MTPTSSAARSHLTLVQPEVERDPAERRVHPRLTLSELEWLTSVRLKYGPVVSLIDWSTGGAQIETSRRLQPGSTVVVEISGSHGDVAVPSSVVRCHVSRVTPHTMYRSALAFKHAFEPPRRDGGGDRKADVIANLVHEHARLTGALRQLSHSQDAGEGPTTLVGEGVLTATLALIESPSARRAGVRFRQDLTQVFRELTRDVESGAGPDVMLARLAERLRRSVPAKTIRIVEGDAPLGPHGPDTIYFDAASDGRVVARLIVEFPPNCALEEWHFQLLKTAAQLVALVGEVARLRALPPPEPVATEEPAPADPPPPIVVAPVPVAAPAAAPVVGWSPVVARYLDGRVLKGYSRGFMPARGHLQVSPSPDAPAESLMSVPLTFLKAIFFVQDAERSGTADAVPSAPGRRVIVTFVDGEVLTGTTLNYTADGPGFFVSPNGTGNNVRVFALTAAVRHAQFP